MSLLADAAVGELLGTLSVAVSAMYTLDRGMPRSAAATCSQRTLLEMSGCLVSLPGASAKIA